MSFINYYEVLQVRPNADPVVIDAAAKALLKTNHPDVGGRNTIARSLLDAKEILTDATKRSEFDAELRARLDNTIGPYKIIKKIADGGFGRTYEAIHLTLDERVCIKQNINVSAYDTEMLKKEAKSIYNLRHPSLPAVRDFMILEDGSCILVMSYIEGPTLYKIIEDYHAKNKELDPENACWIMSRVLDALRYTHYNGVVHGDVKPQNIILQPEQHTCALVDFGLATNRPTKNSKPEGYTEMFAAPESLLDKPPLPETDLYCLGLTMIYALGGNPKTRKIPASTPKPIKDFLQDLVIYDIAQRPHWGKVDLLDKLNKARKEAFGREHTNFKKL